MISALPTHKITHTHRQTDRHTYIVLTRVRMGEPKNAGTVSSISEWVFLKLSVRSGSVRESLWQEPGRGSGT